MLTTARFHSHYSTRAHPILVNDTAFFLSSSINQAFQGSGLGDDIRFVLRVEQHCIISFFSAPQRAKGATHGCNILPRQGKVM